MSWGTFWGTAFGGSDELAGGFWVESAYASSSKSFIIVYSVRPVVLSPIWVGDASNLSNITLSNLDTAATVSLIAARPVLSNINAVEYVLMSSFQANTSYGVTVANLVGYLGEELVEPKSATFATLPATSLPIRQRRPLLDLLNPQMDGELINGGLVNGSNGDYTKESGVSLMRKLIIRRIITARDAYYHLAGLEYGFGIQAKEFLSATDLIILRTKMSEEIAKEPEISLLSIALDLENNGVLTVHVQAVLKRTGQQITLSIPLPQSVQL